MAADTRYEYGHSPKAGGNCPHPQLARFLDGSRGPVRSGFVVAPTPGAAETGNLTRSYATIQVPCLLCHADTRGAPVMSEAPGSIAWARDTRQETRLGWSTEEWRWNGGEAVSSSIVQIV